MSTMDDEYTEWEREVDNLIAAGAMYADEAARQIERGADTDRTQVRATVSIAHSLSAIAMIMERKWGADS